MWRSDSHVLVRDAVSPVDIPQLNRLFSDSFTDRYRRDGMTSMRVPNLNPAIWRFAIERAGEGAMVWRDSQGLIAAFNMVHRSGSEGWMGPLAVRVDRQGRGVGRTIVMAGVDHLRNAGATVIGLETMPRTVDNIGFYSRLGFIPGPLTISMGRTSGRATVDSTTSLGSLPAGAGAGAIERCARLCQELAPGLNFTREIMLTLEHGLGDLLILGPPDAIEGFALWHHAPLAAGRAAEEVRVLKLVTTDVTRAMRLIDAVGDAATRLGLRRVTVRCQTAERALYRALAAAGWEVLWTDLRLTLSGHEEQPRAGVVLSNWEV